MKYNNKHVPNSPFRVRAGPPFDASKVKVSGVEESPVTDEPAQVLCDCTEAGTAPLTGMDTVIGVAYVNSFPGFLLSLLVRPCRTPETKCFP